MQVEGNSTSKPHDPEKIVANSGCASILAATDAVTPTMSRIERAAIDAATPITDHPRDLFVIHEHLLASGLFLTAAMLLKEAQLEPSPSLKLKLSDLIDMGVLSSSQKGLTTGDLRFNSPTCPTPGGMHNSSLLTDATGLSRPSSILRNQQGYCTSAYVDESQCNESNLGQVKPSSLLMNDDPHVCLEPKQSLRAPCNVTSRLVKREITAMDGVHVKCRNRQFLHSRFKLSCSTFTGHMLTCFTFLGDSHAVSGSDDGEITIFGFEDGLLTYDAAHEYPLTVIQSFNSGDTQLLLSSSSNDVKLWDVSQLFRENIIGLNHIHLFGECKAARVSNSGDVFAALSLESTQCEILLYDIQTCQLASSFSDTSTTFTGRDHLYSQIHFGCSDSMLLCNGVLWDRRVSDPVHRFDQLTDFRGGGFHPAGNEVIINSEVWDLRKLRLLHSVPSLDKTTITFNAGGDVIYAILRRDEEDILSAFDIHRLHHPLFAAFRTVDAVNYSDIATIPMDDSIVDLKTEPTDSLVGLLILSHSVFDEEEDEDKYEGGADVYGIVKIYGIGE